MRAAPPFVALLPLSLLALTLAPGCTTTYLSKGEGGHWVNISGGRDSTSGEKTFIHPSVVTQGMSLRGVQPTGGATLPEIGLALSQSIVEYGYGRFVTDKGAGYVTVDSKSKTMLIKLTLEGKEQQATHELIRFPAAFECKDAAGAVVTVATGEDVKKCAALDAAAVTENVKPTGA